MSKVMVVEDDASLREIYSVRITAEGYDVVSAGDGEEALAVAVREKPDLILSDVMMPRISGFDMLDIIRSTPETAKIKVIMMTALSSEDQRQRGESLGANRYLVKSQVGIEDVINAIHEVLGDKTVSGTEASGPAPALATPTAPAPATPAIPTVQAPVPPAATIPSAPSPATPASPTSVDSANPAAPAPAESIPSISASPAQELEAPSMMPSDNSELKPEADISLSSDSATPRPAPKTKVIIESIEKTSSSSHSNPTPSDE